jgi:hypothetical protein
MNKLYKKLMRKNKKSMRKNKKGGWWWRSSKTQKNCQQYIDAAESMEKDMKSLVDELNTLKRKLKSYEDRGEKIRNNFIPITEKERYSRGRIFNPETGYEQYKPKQFTNNSDDSYYSYRRNNYDDSENQYRPNNYDDSENPYNPYNSNNYKY